MESQTVGNVGAVALVLIPVIAVSYAMTSDSPKRKALGYYGLSALAVLASAGCFALAVSGTNSSGFVWMAILAYASYWAWRRGRETGSS